MTTSQPQTQQDKIEKFNQWMRKISNIYYADHKRMLMAYDRLTN